MVTKKDIEEAQENVGDQVVSDLKSVKEGFKKARDFVKFLTTPDDESTEEEERKNDREE